MINTNPNRVALPEGLVGGMPTGSRDQLRQDELDSDDYSTMEAHVIVLPRDDGLDTIAGNLAAPFHLINLLIRYYDAGFILAALLILILLAVYALLWVLALEYTFLKEVFATRDIPSSFSIVNLIIALIYGDLVRQSLTAYDTPPRQLMQLQHYVSQLGRKYWVNARLPRTLRQLEEGKGRKLTNPEKQRLLKLRRDYVDWPMELLKAMNYYTLHLYLEGNDEEKPQFDEGLLHSVRKWNLLQTDDVPEVIEELLDLFARSARNALDVQVLDAQGRTHLQQTEEQIRERIYSFKEGRAIHVPDIFYGVLRLALAFYLFFMLPISIYDAIDVYMPISFALVLFMILGPIYFRWWLGSAFERNARYSGMPFYKHRAKVYLKICMKQRLLYDEWAYEAGLQRLPPDMDRIIRETLGAAETSGERLRKLDNMQSKFYMQRPEVPQPEMFQESVSDDEELEQEQV